MLRIYPVALQVAADAAILAKAIAVHDKDLARQLKRAAASICLNIAEGSGSRAGTRRARYDNALGSARETGSCYDVAEAMRYIPPVDRKTRDSFDHVIGTLVKLT